MNTQIGKITTSWGVYFSSTEIVAGHNKPNRYNIHIQVLADTLQEAIDKVMKDYPDAELSSVHKRGDIHIV